MTLVEALNNCTGHQYYFELPSIIHRVLQDFPEFLRRPDDELAESIDQYVRQICNEHSREGVTNRIHALYRAIARFVANGGTLYNTGLSAFYLDGDLVILRVDNVEVSMRCDRYLDIDVLLKRVDILKTGVYELTVKGPLCPVCHWNLTHRSMGRDYLVCKMCKSSIAMYQVPDNFELPSIDIIRGKSNDGHTRWKEEENERRKRVRAEIRAENKKKGE